MPKRIPKGFGKKTLAEDFAFKLKLMESNPTELYLMVVRNECTLEDLAKLYLRVQGDWYLEEYAELLARLILQDETAASRETFRILDEIAKQKEAYSEIKNPDWLIFFEIDEAFEEHYWEMAAEEWEWVEKSEQEIREYMESEDSV